MISVVIALLDICATVVNSDTSLWCSMWSFDSVFCAVDWLFWKPCRRTIAWPLDALPSRKSGSNQTSIRGCMMWTFFLSQGSRGTAHLVAIAETGWTQWQAHVWETKPLPPCVLATFCGWQANVAKSLSHTEKHNAFKGMKSPRTPTRVVPSPAPAIIPKRSLKPLQPRSLLVNLTSPNKPTVQMSQGMKLTKVHTHSEEVSSTVEIGGVQDASLSKIGSGMPLKQKAVVIFYVIFFLFFSIYSYGFIYYLLSYKKTDTNL